MVEGVSKRGSYYDTVYLIPCSDTSTLSRHVLRRHSFITTIINIIHRSSSIIGALTGVIFHYISFDRSIDNGARWAGWLHNLHSSISGWLFTFTFPLFLQINRDDDIIQVAIWVGA